MDFKIYNNILSDDNISYILNNIDTSQYHSGRVGNRINLKQKIRKDLFIKDNSLLKYIDDTFYDKMYHDIQTNFSNIKYRERWKIGFYDNEDAGFYNLHTDTAGDTKYRVSSAVAMLSSADDYEGGELHFPDLNKKFKLDKGDVIVFKSSLLHGVHPITKGKRHVLISFFFDDDGMKVKETFTKNVNYNDYKPYLTNIKLEYHTNNYKSGSEINTYNKGDIDYSDLHHRDKWSDLDDYYLEDNDSDTLIVSFSGMGWKDAAPTFIFNNFLKQYENVDKLFLRDMGPNYSKQICCRYYLLGFRNSTNNLEESIEFIKNLITQKKYNKIIAIGCSAGGYAAILFGHLLKFNKVIAFAPQVVLNNKKEELIGDIYNATQTCRWLTNKNKDNEFYQKCLDLKNFTPFNTSIDIHYSKEANNGIDKKHALYLQCENCKIIEHPGNNHMVALTLRNNGKLKEIIDELVNN
jgi:predicted 2-oxoglutarate/Fe(II)-dependent dioxygenase YbiX/predicted esterase YcpF (UPF0227 family)